MTMDETLEIMGVLQIAYPSYYRNISRQDAISTAALWQKMFADDEYQAVCAAVNALIATKVEGYPPTIGAVKEKLYQVSTPNEMTAQDAWALVNKAVRSLDWFNPEKSFNKLPELAQRAVGSPSVLKEWGMTDEQAFETVIYSQFVKAYGVYQQRTRDMAMVPTEVRDMLSGVAAKMSLTDGSETA